MFDNSSYIPSPILPASPLTPLDAYVMADLILGTITGTDPAIAAEIVEYIVLHDISGIDFFDLSRTHLRMLSKDNYQVFKELRKLQKARIFPDAIPSSSTPSLSSTFPEFSSLIHNCRLSSSSSMLGVQTPEDFNDEAWDFGDEDDLRTPELHTTVVEAAVPQDGINLPNHSLNPALENGSPLASTLEQPLPITHTHTATTPTSDGATYVHSAEEAHTSELQPEPINADDASIYGLNESQLVINSLGSQSVVRLDGENTRLQNDSVLAGPILCTLNTRSSSPSLSYVDGEDSDTTTHPQNDSVLSGPISCTPGTGSSFSALPYVDGEGSDAATHPQNDFVLAGPISCTPSTRSSSPALSYVDDEDPDAVAHLQNDSVLAGPILCMPSTRSSSPTLSYDVDDENPDAAATQLSQIHLSNNSEPIPRTTLDPNMRIEHDGLPIFSSHSTSATEPLTQDFLVESQLESSPSRSLDHPQTMVDSWQNLTTEDEEALEPRLPASEPAAQTMVESWQVLTEEDGEALEPPRLPASEEPAASDTYFDDNEAPLSSDSSREEPEDAIHEDDSPRGLNRGSKDRRDSFTSNETHESIESCQSSPSTLHLEPSHDIDDSTRNELDTANFTLPIDIIPMTPPGSPIFEGLSQYMIHEAVLEVNQDNVSTRFQRDLPTGEPTLWPSSEAPRFGLPLSSENGQSLRSGEQAPNPPESPEPNADVAIQPDPPSPHRPSHARGSTSPFEFIQSGILRLMPTTYALRRETFDRTT